jgi:hypothetical protein
MSTYQYNYVVTVTHSDTTGISWEINDELANASEIPTVWNVDTARQVRLSSDDYLALCYALHGDSLAALIDEHERGR